MLSGLLTQKIGQKFKIKGTLGNNIPFLESKSAEGIALLVELRETESNEKSQENIQVSNAIYFGLIFYSERAFTKK